MFEHVNNPAKAVAEVNRVAARGYIETPSPLREQLACPIPFEAEKDFHTLFCWSTPGTLHVVKKSAQTVGEFPDTPAGKFASGLFRIQREKNADLEPLLPRAVKTTKLHFREGVRLQEHASFAAAAKAGFCAFEPTVNLLRKNLSFPLSLRAYRFRKLRSLLKAHELL